MSSITSVSPTTEQFILRWKASGASERANYQLFLTELCELLGVEKPRPASDKVHEAAYTFERPVDFDDGEGKKTTNFIDLYKQHCFVLEAKQGSDKAVITEAELLGADKAKTKTGTATRDTRTWEREMKKAKEQALRYARSLPASEGWPPFLVVVDVGFCIDLYSDFGRQGKTYIPFPGPLDYRLQLVDLEKEEIQQRLRLLFTDPLELDPSKRAAKVTRELAERLARLAALLEQSGHSPERVAGFLMRCLFTMFAEDVELLPERSFTKLLEDYKHNLPLLPDALQSLWTSMDKGGFDPALRTLIPQFNGFLYKEQEALPLTEAQLDLLILASKADWADVEPAIFGTLLERALQPKERHKLGAHFTPRAYVERLVMPTVIEPLREEWEAAQTASAIFETKGDDVGALKEIQKFHRRLCSVKILDPACGSGNFLYVTLEHLKRLEGEVAEYIAHFPRQLGLDMTGGYTVTPAQLLGLEVNPRAAAIADVVLWIGYLQWHFRTHGHAKRLENPILRQYGNIVQQDAVLSFMEKKPRLDNNGEPITRWDGHTTKQHPITGSEVPDETALVPVYDYVDPKPATWPEADFIVGNPPFVGMKKMRLALGDGYTESLRKAYPDVPESADLVMYWWHKAAIEVRSGKAQQFGFITTNSITQIFNRRIIESHVKSIEFKSLPPLCIAFAIPDHPWVDSADAAGVTISMMVCNLITKEGRLLLHKQSNSSQGEEFIEKRGLIYPDFQLGIDVSGAETLKSNASLAYLGVKFYGQGFVINQEQFEKLKKTSSISIVKNFISGRDLANANRGLLVIDCDKLDITELRDKYPDAFQHLLLHVKPERDQNPRESKRKKWWVLGENQPAMRKAMEGLNRYITTAEVSKFRHFHLFSTEVLPEGTVIAIAVNDSFFLGILSSNIHLRWALSTGSDLGGNTPRYNKTRCFDTFPFPNIPEVQKQQIRTIAEQIDAHRKHRQALHPTVTITDMYNVMEKLRSGETLTAKGQEIHEKGLVSILLQLHNELDTAVASAYGWPVNLTEEEILENLVALNKERAAEEARGLIRWLRPEYQNPQGVQQTGLDVATTEATEAITVTELSEWPKSLAEQAQAVQRMIQQYQHPVSATEINKQFKKATKAATASREQQIGHILETISTLGLLRKTEGGLFVR